MFFAVACHLTGDAGLQCLAVEGADAASDGAAEDLAAVPQRLAVLHLERGASVGTIIASGGDAVSGAGPAEGDGFGPTIACVDASGSRASGVDDAAENDDVAKGIDGKHVISCAYGIQGTVALLLAVDGEVTTDNADFIAVERRAVAEDEVDVVVPDLEIAGDGGVAADHVPAGGAESTEGDIAATAGDGRVVTALLLDAVAVDVGEDGQELVAVYDDIICGHGERRAVNEFGGLVHVAAVGGGKAGPLSCGNRVVVREGNLGALNVVLRTAEDDAVGVGGHRGTDDGAAGARGQHYVGVGGEGENGG